MIDKTKNEALALEHGSVFAGQFAQEMISNGYGSDMAKWPRDAWMALIEAAVTGFVERMQELKGTPDA